jgi:hypothetical protein
MATAFGASLIATDSAFSQAISGIVALPSVVLFRAWEGRITLPGAVESLMLVVTIILIGSVAILYASFYRIFRRNNGP